jgi:hypothetical protein
VLAMSATLFASEPVAVTLVRPGSIWRFYEHTQAPSPLWKTTIFAEDAWRLGPAQFGHGEGDEATTIAAGTPRITTHYFRHKFNVPRAADFTNLLARVLRDDGVVVYINEREVFRMNMPHGDINHLTYASSQVAETNENFFFSTNFSSAVLVDGQNTLAVELHQTEGAIDASFDMSLTASGPPREANSPRLTAARAPQGLALSWDDSDVFLEQRLLPHGAWQTLTNAVSPYEIPLPTDSRLFRLRRK